MSTTYTVIQLKVIVKILGLKCEKNKRSIIRSLQFAGNRKVSRSAAIEAVKFMTVDQVCELSADVTVSIYEQLPYIITLVSDCSLLFDRL